ncbi:MAG: imidazole glycerol phosphate synthase subunit HisH [Anaerolineae bacterium]|nr:imidazole glycerol phosphate synthase subunit HisH [Anaerolineae bacterium]
MTTPPAGGPLLTMIDYGGSNLRSAQKALEAVGARVQVTDDPAVVRAAARLVLPGVGAFGAGMAALRARGLAEATVAAVAAGATLLGICLGMQFLFDESEEMGRHAGLGLLAGRVVRFPAGLVHDGRPLKVPHVGWNEIEPVGAPPLLDGIGPAAHTYFVHSFYCAPADVADVLATADYGGRFAAIVGRGRVFGYQFHPEKSQRVGLRLLRNYITLEAA